MIGHKGKPKGVDVEETEDRKERSGEEQRRHQSAASGTAKDPENDQSGDGCSRASVGQGVSRIRMPPRVKEIEVDRPKQLSQIEPGNATGQLQTRPWTKGEFRAAGPNVGMLNPRREKPRGRAKGEPRQEGNDVAFPPQGSAPPPDQDHKCGRKRRSHGLRHDRHEEKNRGGHIEGSVRLGTRPPSVETAGSSAGMRSTTQKRYSKAAAR